MSFAICLFVCFSICLSTLLEANLLTDKTEGLIGGLTDWPTDWMDDWIIDWLTVWLSESHSLSHFTRQYVGLFTARSFIDVLNKAPLYFYRRGKVTGDLLPLLNNDQNAVCWMHTNLTYLSKSKTQTPEFVQLHHSSYLGNICPKKWCCCYEEKIVFIWNRAYLRRWATNYDQVFKFTFPSVDKIFF